MGVFRRAGEPEAWDYATIYTAKGVAQEVAQRYCWPNDEDETVGLLVYRIREDGMADLRVNPVLVTWRDGEVWIWTRNNRSRLTLDTYFALVDNGVCVRGIGTVTHLKKIAVDWMA